MTELNVAVEDVAKENTENSNPPPPLPIPDTFNGENLLNEFVPVPYLFLLKDAKGNPISLPPKRIVNARIECPSFHVLVDHLMAVLWRYYSRKGLELLESNQIHWALKILEGTRNSYGQYTEDVEMAINHLTDAYVDVCSKADLEKLQNRAFVAKADTFPPREVKKVPLNKKVSTSEYGTRDIVHTSDVHANVAQQNALKNASLHLADMIANADPAVLKELMVQPNFLVREVEKKIICVSPYSAPLPPSNEPEDVRQEHQKLIDLRNSKFQTVVEMFEEIRKLDETLQDMPSTRGEALMSTHEPILKKIDDEGYVASEKKSEEAVEIKE